MGRFYAGASFGVAVQGARKDEFDPSASNSTTVSGMFTGTVASSDVLTSSLGGRGPGAMANLFLGYNYMLPSDYLIGGQIEGSVSNMRTTLTGPSSDPAQQFVTNNNAGVITTQTITQLNSGNATGHLDNRWAMAALVRGGLVVDPKDLVYLIGGLTYARFEIADGDQSFGGFGGTAGAKRNSYIASGRCWFTDSNTSSKACRSAMSTSAIVGVWPRSARLVTP
jgi:hypothetical protein